MYGRLRNRKTFGQAYVLYVPFSPVLMIRTKLTTFSITPEYTNSISWASVSIRSKMTTKKPRLLEWISEGFLESSSFVWAAVPRLRIWNGQDAISVSVEVVLLTGLLVVASPRSMLSVGRVGFTAGEELCFLIS